MFGAAASQDEGDTDKKTKRKKKASRKKEKPKPADDKALRDDSGKSPQGNRNNGVSLGF